MNNVLILGAGGQVAVHVIARLSGDDNIRLTLYLRNTARLKDLSADRTFIVEGDIMDDVKLSEAMQGQDIVYVNINGNEDVLAQQVVNAMQSAGVKRLIFVAAIGIYDEVPGAFGKWNQQMIGEILIRYSRAADLIETSGLDYTILRPTWYTDQDEINYHVSRKGEPVTGTEISRKSVADLIVRIVQEPSLYTRESVGMEKTGTKGDKPAWYR